METKQLEIRDDGILINVIAILVGIGRSIIRPNVHQYQRTILITKIPTLESQADPSKWKDTTTMARAHLFIERNWKHIVDGAVIDVRDIRTDTHARAA